MLFIASYSYQIFRQNPRFPRDFPAKRKIFPQIHRNTLENSKSHPIRRLAHWTETYPILERFLFLFTTRRFGGVGAPEGREKVSAHIFLKKVMFLAEDYGINRISRKMCFWRKIMDDHWIFSQNLRKLGS